MKTSFYVDASGNYIGGFCGVPAPAGGIEVPTAPDDARQKWNGSGWDAYSDYRESRATEYPSIGEQLDALYKAGVFPADMADQIKAVKDKYPKG